ncbi:MFS transporter [archaeon]|jgi:MFS family permease|nr:MFS transporter [archaeon]MBT3451267.1 MFS transporter [archaeon]MBT6869550.1 MFS transporter [archaeon]MBT7193458.1 MFS transporter [archaeon]MBT7381049.1 MFS transporter [archaeon]
MSNSSTLNLYKRNISLMYFLKFFQSLHFFSAVLIPFFIDWGGINFTQIMILQSVFVFSAFAMEVPTGVIADYFGRKHSIALAIFFNIAGILVYASYPNFYIFVIAEFLWAIANALMSGADQAMVYDSLKKYKSEHLSKKIFARFKSFNVAAIMISGPIGSLIATYLGLRATMLFMAFPMIIALIISLFLTEPRTKKSKESKRYLQIFSSGVKHFRNNKILQILSFDMISNFALVFMVIWTYQLLLEQLGVAIIYFGFVHAAIAGIQVIFLNSVPWMEKLFKSKKNYLLWSAVIPGLAYLVLATNQNIYLAVLLLMLITGFGLTRSTLFDSYINKYIESHNRSTVISFISMLKKFTIGVIYPIVGILVDWSLTFTFIIIGSSILGMIFISRVEEEHLLD